MSTIIDLMLAVREREPIFYHKDTNQFDHYPVSEIERESLSPDKLHQLDLYDDFIDACGSIYIQIFEEWASENGLNFKKEQESSK